jgi:hypothetical protein
MSDDLVKQLRNRADRCMKYGYEEHSKIDTEAADRIEQLEALVSYLAGTNKDHVKVMLAGNPIVCDEIMSNARAALDKTDDCGVKSNIYTGGDYGKKEGD